jgi:branched-chain amino acid transport system substrate-binding protein
MAQISGDVVKIGVLTDLPSRYSDINGQGAIVATRMAIDDAGGSVAGKKIEKISAEVQNKADAAAGIAGRWLGSTFLLWKLVEPRGIEPLTFALRTRRSPS